MLVRALVREVGDHPKEVVLLGQDVPRRLEAEPIASRHGLLAQDLAPEVRSGAGQNEIGLPGVARRESFLCVRDGFGDGKRARGADREVAGRPGAGIESAGDGTSYLLAAERDQQRLFNLAFVTGLEETGVRFDPDAVVQPLATDDTFGARVGAGEPVEVTVRIRPPEARYFARQRWHGGQHDRWDGEVLVRAMRAHVPPELVRRLLSLGGALEHVSPESARAAVLDAASRLVVQLDGSRPAVPSATEPTE